MAVDHTVHRGPTLSTHLSIAYSANAASSSAAASTGVAASASGAASASAVAGSPGNFLAALIDQLLAGAAARSTGSTPGAATGGALAASKDAATAGVPNLLNLGIDAQATTAVAPPQQGNVLLTKLTTQLQTLQQQLAKGEQPDPDLLAKLGQTADALAALIAKPAATGSTSATLDPLATLKSVKSNVDDKATSDIPGAEATKPATTPDQITQLLAAIGIQLPQASTTSAAADQAATDTGTVTTTTQATPLPAIAQLATQLAQLSQAVAASSPEVAQKLDALTQKLASAESDPTVLAQLTASDDGSAITLDKAVQSLLASKPGTPTPTTPQLASNIHLENPAPQTNAPPPSPSVAGLTVTGTAPGPKVAPAAKPTDTPAKDTPTSTADAKIVAAATAQADPKAGTADDTAQTNTTAVAAPPATQAAARAIPVAYQTASSPINMAQVAFEMVRQVHQGQSRFSIRIDPPELGRVDVKMHVDASGNVNARLTVERSETLDMFQRDRGSLEKALTQAGLDGSKTNLEFSLKQNPFAGMAGYDQRPSNGSSSASRLSLDSADAEDASVSAIPSVTLYRGIASSGGVNLFV